LPGTGKTTISECIYKLLNGKSIKTELLLEDNEKIPCNFCDIAGIPKSERFNFPIKKYLTAETDNYFYVNLKKFDKITATQLKRYDIGDEYNKFISVKDYVQCTLEWWGYWVDSYVKDSVIVLDSAFLQCPINEMIFRGASDNEVLTYIQHIAEIIKPFNPICIYLRRESAKIAIDFAKEVKGEKWVKGLDGLVELGCADLFERRFRLENLLLPEIPGITCNITDIDWSDAINKIQRIV